MATYFSFTPHRSLPFCVAEVSLIFSLGLCSKIEFRQVMAKADVAAVVDLESSPSEERRGALRHARSFSFRSKVRITIKVRCAGARNQGHVIRVIPCVHVGQPSKPSFFKDAR